MAPLFPAVVLAQTPVTIIQQPADLALLPGSNGTFTVAAAGIGPFYYQWQFNGSNIPALIFTGAGNGSNGYSGNGSPATNAALSFPRGVAVDASNNLFIADFADEVVRKVGTNGIITTVAGNGKTNYSGDGVQATNTAVNPAFVTVDSSGNLFIADYTNSRIRKVAVNGIISTVAGTNTSGFSGDGGKATNAALYYPTAVVIGPSNALYVADSFNNRIRKIGTNGIISTVAGTGTNGFFGDGGPATNANLSHPGGLAVDSVGNLYISDTQNYRVRKVGTNGVISTIAGTGTNGPITNGIAATNAALGLPEGLALDAVGRLYIADASNECVLKLSPTGLLTTAVGVGTNGDFGDGGPAALAELSAPMDAAVDSRGDIFIADAGNSRVREVVAQGPAFSISNASPSNVGAYDVVVTSPYGKVTSADAFLLLGTPPVLLGESESVTNFAGSNVLLSVSISNMGPLQFQWQLNGSNIPVPIITVAGNGTNGESGDGGLATNAEIYAGSVAVDQMGNFYIADSANNRIRKVDSAGIITTIAGNGDGGFSGDGGPATNASLFNPAAVAIDPAGNIYIADEANDRVRVVSTNGVISTFAGDGTNGFFGDGGAATNADLADPSGLAIDQSGNVFIADMGNNRIRKVGTNGIITTIAGTGTNGYFGDGGPALAASFSHPSDVALDVLGNLFVADAGNIRVRRISPDGVVLTVAGHGAAGYYGDGAAATNAFFEAPQSISADGLGNLYIADGTEHVREVTPSGIISTVAGNAGFGYSGDGGPATNSRLRNVYGVAADMFGSLYIADTGDSRIREIPAFGPSLPLAPLTTNEAGAYDLVVTGPFGSVTSAVIDVTVLMPPPPPPPPLAPLTLTLFNTNTLIVQFTGGPGTNYVLQSTTNLSPPVIWQTIATNAATSVGTGIFIETNIQAQPAVFFRLGLP